MSFKLAVAMVAAAAALVPAKAENHTITFNNHCVHGTPTVKSQNGSVLSTGTAPFTINGPLIGAIAFLQTGVCGPNGEKCLIVETTLSNGNSSTDLSLIPPHAFQVATGFNYYNGCNGAGHDCTSANCTDAFHQSNDTGVQVGCSADNVDLSIYFCG
ncbi:hypothetical protein WOLCODRAFT_156965 [Wolfiporia cocos MD-104 SS10]|uniref:Glycopeptide n=1 Tax=Wolfiporia cocos (strain MD-104) TaxID=742152 RepID=A0A2H3J1Y9_WOLCO|nr:hypothetical protein WOLCODRAFT_156965 [Wolfiporia cocos MD-104 SS10]